ncbi:hypothetical protein WA026_013615 [Henosepilachna vigintioctopunctata]|uniref:Uncharacterized protein n=1 Tax=Henosepilachna vigintioctopunctata TaxID=420089 RepID=A0AAW1V826_9CUCU
MKYMLVGVLFALFGLVVCRPEDQYTNKYDNIDIEEIIKSDRLINSYFKCLMTGEGCTPDGAELRKILPDAIHSGCSKCSRKHKDVSKRMINHLIKNKPELWKQLEEKFDPQATYRTKYKDELEKEGFKGFKTN